MNTQATVKPKVRCAIYTRKSTEKGLDSEFNSLDAQRDYCKRYIQAQEYEGWYLIPESYDDGAYTGYNTKRPAFQRLIADVKTGLIDVVLVYKTSRLARSLLDALQVMRLFKDHNVGFVSVTQKFDTTTPHGRLSMHIMMSFDECLREISREQTLDKIALSKERGLWMGGNVPFGYNNVNKKLVINPEQAETVRLIFNLFLQKRSLKKVALALIEMDIRNKAWVSKSGKAYGGAHFNMSSLNVVINNPIYIGKVRHKGALYEGEHEAIITDDVWQKVRGIIGINPKLRSSATKRKIPAVLQGLLKCGGCDSHMTPSHTRKKNGKIYRYYVPHAHQKAKCINCPIKQLSAPEVENAVLSQLQGLFKAPELLVNVWKENKTGRSEEEIRGALSNINAVWAELFPAEQERLLKLMLDRVIVQPGHLELKVKVDGFESFMLNSNQPQKVQS